MISRFHHTIVNSDATPSTQSNDNLNEFLNYKIGMFISYGLTSFTTSDKYATNWLLNAPNPSTFNAPSNVDVAQWVAEAINANCDYIILTTGHHIGFNLFPYTAPYDNANVYDSNRGVLNVPQYTVYDVRATPSSDQNIISKFKTECETQGIKFGLYYNVGKNINIRRGLNLIDASYDQTNTYSLAYQNYVNYAIKEIEYISSNYQPDYIWLDAPHFAPRFVDNVRTNRRYFQDFYNAVKRNSPHTLVLANYDCADINGNRELLAIGTDTVRPPFTWSGDEMMIFPCDVPSFEYSRIPYLSSDFNPINNHEGIDYFMPKEIIDTILTGGQYFAENDNFNAVDSLSSIQGKYNKAKLENAPFLLSVAPAKNGVIPQNQLDRFNEIVL